MIGCGRMTTTTLLSLPSERLLHTTIPTYPAYSYYRMWRIGWLGQDIGPISCTVWLQHRRCGPPDQLLT